jgi:hypothetical protein
MGLDWLPSDSGFLTTDDGNLLLVSTNGTSRVLWSPSPLKAWWARPSPDEKHLAISVSSQQSNAWMVTGFSEAHVPAVAAKRSGSTAVGQR